MSLLTHYKRIVVCCDGTWCTADKSGNLPSNVARMSRAIAKFGKGANGQPITQIAYYQSGVASGTLGPLDKIWQGAFGTGLAANVCEAYNFIASNWAPGDELSLFGFSRGAFTARSIAGLICEVGLLEATAMEFFAEMYQAYQTKGELELSQTIWARTPYSMNESKTMWQEFTSHLQKDVKIKVVGVWDTVGSLGLPDTTLISKWTGWNKRHQFHNTRLDPKIHHAFHALALDERRGNFPPTMWYLEDDNTTTELRQCWFSGYHSDIGGGTTDGWTDRNEIDEITFAWMCDQVSPFIQLDSIAMDKTLLLRILTESGPESGSKILKSFKNTATDKYSAIWSKVQWGSGSIVDSMSSLYMVMGGEHIRHPGETDTRYPDGRLVPREHLYEVVHPSVQYRVQSQPDYQPRGLRTEDGWTFNDGSDGEGRRWMKSVTGTEDLCIMEYVIPASSSATFGSLERKFAPKDLLKKLDDASGGLKRCQ